MPTAWNSTLNSVREKPIGIKKKSKLPKVIKITKLEKKLERILYPLVKAAEINTCVSCGKENLIKYENNAGHYAKAELCNIVWRYFPLIIHPQCTHCNLGSRGNTLEYRKQMILIYGLEIVEFIDAHYKDILPMNFNERLFLERLIDWYKKEPVIRRYTTLTEVQEDLKIFTNLGIYNYIP